MKKLLIVIQLCFWSVMMNAQAQDIISSENLTAQKLKEIFESAYADVAAVDPNGKYIAVKESAGLKVYMDIDAKKRYITYSISFKCDERFSECEILALVNQLSTQVLMISPSYMREKRNLLIKYDYWVDAGVTSKSIVKTEKQFMEAVKLAFKKDIQKILI
ncbi:MAG: hypothetical protein AAFX87_17360 [Bacteroidota bacterium]